MLSLEGEHATFRSRHRGVATWLAVLLLAAGAARAQEQSPASSVATPSCGMRGAGDVRPRVGLALGGGGARGIAHISVLRKIEELRIPVDCIAGTSMGALVGGLYASGMPAQDLRELVESTDWKRLFDDSLARPERSYRRKQDDRDSLTTVGVGITRKGLRLSPGLLQGERILAMFERNTLGVSAIEDFDLLPIPYRAVATDLNTGEAVVLDHGSLAMAMRASMSLPGIFQPVEVDGRVLLDGGLVNQVPVDIVRGMGADIVIAVDVGTPLDKLDRNASLLQVVSQISGMMTTGNTRRQLQTLADRDVLIVPELGDDVATGDFEKVGEALAIGDRAADAAHADLARLGASQEVYAASRSQHGVEATAPVVEFVRLDNETGYADEMLLDQLRIPVGQQLDADAVESRILRVYSLGTLASVTYEVVREDGRTGVLVRARAKPQGPNYLQLGLTYSSDFEGTFESTLRAGVLFSPLSPFGAEGRVILSVGSEPGLGAEYYHPLDVSNRNLLYARVGYDNPNIHVFDAAGNNFATYDVRVLGVRLQATREFGNYGALSIGTEFGKGKAKVEVGDPALEEFEFDQGALYALVNVDRLDSLFFPRHGHYLALGYTVSRDWLGSDAEYDKFDLDAMLARSFGRHAVQLGGRYHVTTSGQLPLQDRYRLGGRTRLAGFRLNQLTGQHYTVVFVGYSYQLAEVFGRSAQVGGTLEFGNAWERRADVSLGDGILNGSVYLGFDSWLGPMQLGYGWRETGDGVIFLEIGQAF
ncbi:BamA/TamA family outer membrane protein [Lysobacter alkalisoli]|uniref:BamA/TamA family outer membrane protein n=2 Tax=Marilutibacter alkalisoli TaxID=2591633 RepID=A0A514BWR4_9GAMM|nr:BamA/TamA family outer membrane protein [Lysobacter alkalisoli]